MAGLARGFATRLGIAAITFCGVATGTEAGTIWQDDWKPTAPAGDRSAYLRVSKLLDSGELVLSYNDYPSESVIRLRADGSLRWQFGLPADSRLQLRDLEILPSESVALTYERGRDHVALLSADGELQWDIAVVATHVAASGDSLYALGCRDGQPVVTALAPADGSVRWQQVIGTEPARCGPSYTGFAIVADGDGGIVATYASGSLMGKRTLVQLASDGGIGWSRELPYQQLPQWLNARMFSHAGAIYVEAESQLSAFHAADGQQLWQHACDNSLVPFTDGDPGCVEGGNTFVRLRAADGAVVWQRPVPPDRLPAGDGIDLYVIGYNTWERVSGANGASLWNQPLPGNISFSQTWLNGALGQARLFVFGAGEQVRSLTTLRLSDGAQERADTPPLIDVAPDSSLSQVDGNDLFIAAATKTRDAYVRRLSADSGSTIWENRLPAALPTSLSVAADSVTIAEQVPGATQVRSIVRDSGRNRWNRALPVVHPFMPLWLWNTPQGDVLAAANAEAANNYVARLWNLSGVDGSDRWSRPAQQEPDFFTGAEQVFIVVGNDLVTADTALSLSRTQRIDAVTGQTLWNVENPPYLGPTNGAPTPANDTLYLISNIIVDKTLVARSTLDGATRWSLPLPVTAAKAHIGDLAALADGDVLLAADSRIHSSDSTHRHPAQLLRVHADGSGVRYHWQGEATAASISDTVARTRVDAAAQTIWLLRSLSADSLALSVLERFDLATGEHQGAQFYRVDGTPLDFPSTAWDADFSVHQGSILSGGNALTPPATRVRRHSLRNFHIAAHGDLILTVAPLQPAPVGALQALNVRVDYSGDAPTTATLLVDPPWPLHGAAPVCSGSGISHCTVETRQSPWLVRFTAAPGAQLQLNGTLRTLASPAQKPARASAVVFGPEELLETNSANNVVATVLRDAIFTDRFDPVAP